MTPRPLTVEECRVKFLDQIDALVRYTLSDERTTTTEEKVRLVVFSLLNVIDGGSCLPGFDLRTSPHPEDEQYHRDRGENWWPRGVDIAGGLHSQWAQQYRGNTK